MLISQDTYVLAVVEDGDCM